MASVSCVIFTGITYDSNTGTSAKAIDLLKMLKDLFKDSKDKLEAYTNTHPHKDHLSKFKNLCKEIGASPSSFLSGRVRQISRLQVAIFKIRVTRWLQHF